MLVNSGLAHVASATVAQHTAQLCEYATFCAHKCPAEKHCDSQITDISPESSEPQRVVKESNMINKGIPKNKIKITICDFRCRHKRQLHSYFHQMESLFQIFEFLPKTSLLIPRADTLFSTSADAVGLDCAHTLFPSS